MYNRVLTYFLLMLIGCSVVIKGEPGKCRDGVSKDLTPQQRLKQDVFCSYDKDVRPVTQHSSNVTVSVLMFLKFFSLDEISNILELHTWMALSWNDSHLTWTPSDYGNISFLRVNTRDIWSPDLSIYNSGNMDLPLGIKRTLCIVTSKGHVYCVPPVNWPAHCMANLRQWPYDSQECTMIFGSWAHEGELIDLKLSGAGFDLSEFQKSREWELKKVTAEKKVDKYDCCPNSTYPTLIYQFSIKRHASAYAATVIIPSVVIAAMTLITFWLDPKAPHRLALCMVSILCHCLYLQYLGAKLPSNGELTPVIVLLFQDSLIVSGAALILSIILLRLSLLSAYPGGERESIPFWLNSIMEKILNQKFGQILCLGQYDFKNLFVKGDGASLIENGAEVNEVKDKVDYNWFILVKVIDRMAFIIFSLTYVVLLIALIPIN